MKPKFFKSQADFRQWLEKNHAKETELMIGFYKKTSGKTSITYPEAAAESLCCGWIDGGRRRLGEDSYVQRSTPRRHKSIWSNVNVKRVERLKKLGLMTPDGLKAYERRDQARTGIYSFENSPR